LYCHYYGSAQKYESGSNFWGRWNCEDAGATYFIALVGIFLRETLDFFKENRQKLYKGKESET